LAQDVPFRDDPARFSTLASDDQSTDPVLIQLADGFLDCLILLDRDNIGALLAKDVLDLHGQNSPWHKLPES
jgi:hypothetical protein